MYLRIGGDDERIGNLEEDVDEVVEGREVFRAEEGDRTPCFGAKGGFATIRYGYTGLRSSVSIICGIEGV